MKTTSVADEIRDAARTKHVEPARRRGKKTFQIVVGDVHKALKLQNRVPAVCSALSGKAFLEENGLVLEDREGPPSGMGTRVVFFYRFKDSDRPTVGLLEHFNKYRGIAREVFESLGGAEAFIRRERESFERHAIGASDPKDR